MGVSSAWYLQKMYTGEYKHVTESELFDKRQVGQWYRGMDYRAPSPETWFLKLRRCQISDPKWPKISNKTMNPLFKFGYTELS